MPIILQAFLVWGFSVYPAIRCIRIVHGEVTISRITYYLVGVTVFQCITGLLNDNFPAAKSFTDSIVLRQKISLIALIEYTALVQVLILLVCVFHLS